MTFKNCSRFLSSHFFKPALGLIILAGTGLGLYQNCAGGLEAAQFGRSPSSFNGRFTALAVPNEDLLDELARKEAGLGSIAQNPATTIDAKTPDRGICAVRGGAGIFLAPIAFTSRSACEGQCNRFASANPNRTCYWRNQIFLGDPMLSCVVRGGAHRELANLPSVTRAGCQTACDQNAAAAFRYCDWGTERIHHPPMGSECRVRGGAGADLLGGIVFASLGDCQNLCEGFSANAYRSCSHGNNLFRAPPDNSKCEILGGAGRVLAPVFFGRREDCSIRCGQFTANVNRQCWYGKERIQ